MAHVVEFHIDNLAGRRDRVSYRLNRDVNVFWGLNGSGKTSLLKILHSALTNDAGPILRVPFDRAEVHIYSVTHEREFIRTFDMPKSSVERREYIHHQKMGSEVNREAFLEYPEERIWWKTVPGRSAGADSRYEHRYLPITRLSEGMGRRGYARPLREMLDEAHFDKLFAEEIQSLWRSFYTQSLVAIREIQEEGLAEVLNLVLVGERPGRAPKPKAMADERAAYDAVRKFLAQQHGGRSRRIGFKNFAKRFQSEKMVQEVVTKIDSTVSEIERVQEPQRRLESLISDMLSQGKELSIAGGELVVKAKDDVISLESLSSGEKQLLRILLECLAAGPSSVIIDEPELSMHVDWQHRLIESMQTVNSSAQLIIATHSPEVMARIPDDRIMQL